VQVTKNTHTQAHVSVNMKPVHDMSFSAAGPQI